MEKEKVFEMKFSSIYPLLKNKVERKGRSEKELLEIITWLTGYTEEAVIAFITSDITYGDFFLHSPEPNPKRKLITGSVCKIRVEEIDDPLLQDIRYLDKLVDELAKGRSMEKILRS